LHRPLLARELRKEAHDLLHSLPCSRARVAPARCCPPGVRGTTRREPDRLSWSAGRALVVEAQPVVPACVRGSTRADCGKPGSARRLGSCTSPHERSGS
jgi:hypothetical protein